MNPRTRDVHAFWRILMRRFPKYLEARFGETTPSPTSHVTSIDQDPGAQRPLKHQFQASDTSLGLTVPRVR
ncbi:hypothetical protein L596_011445 [Steinernema carpocapsae]|uniref:Uncharacterized protein n=1 Tax=Steinernema carpocapsae TaxID=34508 RepID=A0A4U5NUV0_STECR|nr:hypothetical protein L596_011445 [Steinernema carpocapsae]